MRSGQGSIGIALGYGYERHTRRPRATCEIVKGLARTNSTRSADAREKTHLGFVTGCRTSEGCGPRAVASVQRRRESLYTREVKSPLARSQGAFDSDAGTAPTRLRRVMRGNLKRSLAQLNSRVMGPGLLPPFRLDGQGTSSTPTGAPTFTSSARGEIASLAIARGVFGATRRESTSTARCSQASAAVHETPHLEVDGADEDSSGNSDS